jgi:hypothetical protein
MSSHVWFSNTPNLGATSAVNPIFNAVMAGSTQSIPSPVCIALTLRNWYLVIDVAPGAGKSRTYTIQKNGSNTALAITIANTATTGNITGTDVSFVAGDTCGLVVTESGTPTAATITQSAIEVDTATDGLYIHGYSTQADSAEEELGPLGGSNPGWTDTGDFNRQQLIGVDGTITTLMCRERTAPGAGNSRTYFFKKNGVNQDGSGGTPDTRVVISGTDQQASAGFSLSVVAGDTISLAKSTSGSPAASTWNCGTLAFQPTNPLAYQFSCSLSGADTTGTRFGRPMIAGRLEGFGTPEASHQFIGHGSRDMRIDGIRAALPSSPSSGKSWTWTLRKNGADTGITVTIADTNTTGSMSGSAVTITSGDLWDIEVTATNNPSAATSVHRVVLTGGGLSDVDPNVETRAATNIQTDSATIRGRIDPNLTADVYGYFEWGTDPGNLTNTTSQQLIGSGDVWVNYSAGLTGLTENTTYYFRAVATDGSSPLWYGAILSFSTAVEHVFVDGEVSFPLTMLSFIDRLDDRHVFAEVDLNDPADYEGGYKAPWVLQWLIITRGFSDRTGQIEHMVFGAVLSDTTRFFRALLDDPNNRFLTNRPVWEKMIDDEDRRALRLWRYVANGYVSDYEPRSPLQFQMTGCDWLKKKFSRKARAQRAWQPIITLDDFPACPKENVGKAVPIIYGKVDDRSLIEKDVSSSFPYDSSLPYVGNNGAADVAGGTLNGRVWVYIVVVDAGVEGPIVPFVGAGTIDYNRSVLAVWDAPVNFSPGLQYHIYFVGGDGAAIAWEDFTPQTGARPGSNITFVRRFTHDGSDADNDWDLAPWPAYRQFSKLCTSNTAGEDVLNPGSPTTTAIVDVGHGAYKPLYVGLEEISGTMYHKGLVCRGAISGIQELYVDGFPQNIATDATQAGVGGIWLIPNYPGWDALFPDPYEDHTGARYTVIYGKAGFAGPDRMAGESNTAAEGAPEGPLAVGVTLNVWGIEDIGDGTGELITSLPQQQKHFMRNFLAPDSISLLWLTACPTFEHEPTLDLIDEATFDDVEVIWDDIAGGIEGAFVIGANGEFITALDVLAQFHVSGDWNGTFTRKGQYQVSMEPVDAPVDPVEIDDIVNITADTFAIRDLVNTEFFNILPYTHTRDYTGVTESGWHSIEAGEVDVRDTSSITNYDQERESPTFELAMLREETASAAITAVMSRKLARYRHPLRTASLILPLSGTQIEVGDLFRMSHIEGIGASGWVDRLVRCTRHELDPNLNRVRLEVYDVEPLIGGSP